LAALDEKFSAIALLFLFAVLTGSSVLAQDETPMKRGVESNPARLEGGQRVYRGGPWYGTNGVYVKRDTAILTADSAT